MSHLAGLRTFAAAAAAAYGAGIIGTTEPPIASGFDMLNGLPIRQPLIPVHNSEFT